MGDMNNHGRGGRGGSQRYPGNYRGGRGGPRDGVGHQYKNPVKALKGQIESLPLLNFSKSASNGDELQKWISSLKTYTIANYIKNLDDIFNKEEPAYPVFEEPEFPDEEDQNNIAIMEIWKAEHRDYRDNTKKLDDHKTKLFGVLLGQMSETSKDQVMTTQEGKDAIDGKDPLNLVKAIVSTHLMAGQIDSDQNLYAAETNYRKIQMGETELIAAYHRRFEASLATLRECASRAEKIAAVPDDGLQSIHFISTLNVNYGAYKENFKRGIITKPEDLQDAYEKVVSFGPGRAHYSELREDTTRRNAFVSRRGGRGGRYGNERGGRGGARGACALCKQFGHWKNECPMRKSGGDVEDDVDRAVKQARDGRGDGKQKN
jgi:hypothetical protein